MSSHTKSFMLHSLVILGLFLLQYVLPEYHQLAVTRIMILSIFAMGFNLLFGYTALLSLGHAMFFAAGMYSAGMVVFYFQWTIPVAFMFGIVCGILLATIIGALALRTTGVAFMIVTLMFSQVAYLVITYFTTYTRGDEGLVLPTSARNFDLFGQTYFLTDATTRYNIALILLAITLVICLLIIGGKFGRSLVAIRENEQRTRMLGYNTFAIKLKAVIVSGGISAAAGSTYALMFAYIGSSFAQIQYSIDPLLFTLLGGAGTILGPLLGTFAMFYLIDISSQYTHAYLLVTGIVLVVLILFFPQGILGTLRKQFVKWLP